MQWDFLLEPNQGAISPFRGYYDSHGPAALELMEISFNQVWSELQRNSSFTPSRLPGLAKGRLAEADALTSKA